MQEIILKNNIKITYDKEADAAYIYLTGIHGQIDDTYVTDIENVPGMINLDFSKEKKLLGIEILNASEILPEEITMLFS